MSSRDTLFDDDAFAGMCEVGSASQPGESSRVSVSVVKGPPIAMWSEPTAVLPRTPAEVLLQLEPDQTAIIGRQEGGETEYLDPNFVPTRMLPNGSQDALAMKGGGREMTVSRAHFMLKFATQGMVLINGVPRRGGGIRAPLNGTRMISPDNRPMASCEEYMVAVGMSVTIRLPNGTEIQLAVE